MIWMACYHDTNSMNEEQEETTFTPIFSIRVFHLKRQVFGIVCNEEPFFINDSLKAILKIIKICFKQIVQSRERLQKKVSF